MFEKQPTGAKDRRYAIHPGYVKSLTDGDAHFISFCQLIKLHKLKVSECILWDLHRPETHTGRRWDDYKHIFSSSHLPREVRKGTVPYKYYTSLSNEEVEERIAELTGIGKKVFSAIIEISEGRRHALSVAESYPIEENKEDGEEKSRP